MARRWLGILLRPKVLIPIALAIALLAFALSLGNLPLAAAKIGKITLSVVFKVGGWASVYLIMKFSELSLLLARTGIKPGLRQLVLAFAVGEMMLPVPSGVYIQNYVLKEIQGADLAQSSASTTAMLLLEIYMVLAGLSILRIPGWEWVRPISICILASGTAAAVLSAKYQKIRNPIADLMRRTALGCGLVRMLANVQKLAGPRTLIPALPLSAVYLGALVQAFLDVAQSVGASNMTYGQALKIYFFSLGIVYILAGVAQLGIIEAAGLGAARALGYSYTDGLAMMLGFRIVWVGAVWIMAGIALLLLKQQFRKSPVDHVKESLD